MCFVFCFCFFFVFCFYVDGPPGPISHVAMFIEWLKMRMASAVYQFGGLSSAFLAFAFSLIFQWPTKAQVQTQDPATLAFYCILPSCCNKSNFHVFEACTCRLFFCVNAVGCEWRMLQLFRQAHTRSHVLTSLFIAYWQNLLTTGWQASRQRGNKTNLISLSSLTWPLDNADCGWFFGFHRPRGNH